MKDTTNILSYDQWSSGDYSISTRPTDNDNFTIKDVNTYYTKEWSSNGESSVKTIQTNTGDQWIRVNYRQAFTEQQNITFNCKIYTHTDAIYIRLTNNTVNSGVMVYPSTKVQEITLILNANSTEGIYIYFTPQNSAGDFFLLDDINLSKS